MKRDDKRAWLAATEVSANARFVFLLLELHASTYTGEATISKGWLAGESGLSARSVQRALRELEWSGDVLSTVSPGVCTTYFLASDPGLSVSPPKTHSPEPETHSLPQDKAFKAVSKAQRFALSNGSRTDQTGTFSTGSGWIRDYKGST